jgi:hypothetical protein
MLLADSAAVPHNGGVPVIYDNGSARTVPRPRAWAGEWDRRHRPT